MHALHYTDDKLKMNNLVSILAVRIVLLLSTPKYSLAGSPVIVDC